jgi:hypothetical protein
MSTSSNKQLKGIAGVHFVVAVLSRLGYVALPTIRNLKSFDIVAFKTDLTKTFYLQIKSTDRKSGGFPVMTFSKEANADNYKEELKEKIGSDKNLFYVFVSLSNDVREMPNFYIVPAKAVWESIASRIKQELENKPKMSLVGQLMAWGYYGIEQSGGEKYKNNWGILEQK